ncbi:MAG: PAS domain-containing protein [Paenirhodobacter sp.]|uniref:PAS domain-containing protein n=1 Tax=Paenirhodobacter sp. TaxID=1965326 RepID=UPI003D0BAD48
MNVQTGIAPAQSGEVPFGFDELFYSRTDSRGVIRAGNHVFQRVAGYDWSELLGAPHRVVRHPDTPRGVFRILWDALGNGNPMGAYVKNRTKSGGYYWVFAVLMPIPDGYLSVRLKPSSALFDRVRAFYESLSARERAEKMDPEESAAILRKSAEAEGFSSYTSYMAHALGLELAGRDQRNGQTMEQRTRTLIDMNGQLEKTTQEQRKLLRSFEALQSIPNNMRIVASRLEPSGGPVSAISENYKASSMVISERLRGFVAGRDNLCSRVSREAAKALFLMGANRVLNEMNRNFVVADPVEGIDWEQERALLLDLEKSSVAQMHESMRRAVEHSETLNRSSAEIRRQMLGLDTIRVLGRVECGRMRDSSGGLSATIDQLDTFHADIKNRLETIMRLSEAISAAMNGYMRSEGF